MLRPRHLFVLPFVILCSVTTVWVLIDRRPPEWDHANHLERAVDCYRSLRIVSDSGVLEILEASSFYQPVASVDGMKGLASRLMKMHRSKDLSGKPS